MMIHQNISTKHTRYTSKVTYSVNAVVPLSRLEWHSHTDTHREGHTHTHPEWQTDRHKTHTHTNTHIQNHSPSGKESHTDTGVRSDTETQKNTQIHRHPQRGTHWHTHSTASALSLSRCAIAKDIMVEIVLSKHPHAGPFVCPYGITPFL